MSKHLLNYLHVNKIDIMKPQWIMHIPNASGHSVWVGECVGAYLFRCLGVWCVEYSVCYFTPMKDNCAWQMAAAI